MPFKCMQLTDFVLKFPHRLVFLVAKNHCLFKCFFCMETACCHFRYSFSKLKGLLVAYTAILFPCIEDHLCEDSHEPRFLINGMFYKIRAMVKIRASMRPLVSTSGLLCCSSYFALSLFNGKQSKDRWMD